MENWIGSVISFFAFFFVVAQTTMGIATSTAAFRSVKRSVQTEAVLTACARHEAMTFNLLEAKLLLIKHHPERADAITEAYNDLSIELTKTHNKLLTWAVWQNASGCEGNLQVEWPASARRCLKMADRYTPIAVKILPYRQRSHGRQKISRSNPNWNTRVVNVNE